MGVLGRKVLDTRAHTRGHGTRCRAAQVRDVRRAAGRAADIAREGAYVGPLAHIERGGPDGTAVDLVDRHQIGRVDLDRARRQLDVLARAGTLIRPHAVDRDGGIRGRNLLLLAHELPENAFGEQGRQHVVADVGHAGGLALGIVGRGFAAEHDTGQVALALEGDAAEQARGLPDAHDHHARRKRIERAGMADASLVERAAHLRHEVMGRDAHGLVDREQEIEFTGLALGHAPSIPKRCLYETTGPPPP